MISGKADGPPVKDSEDEGRIGVFPSWPSVYWTVFIYGLVVIAVLTLLSSLLSFRVVS